MPGMYRGVGVVNTSKTTDYTAPRKGLFPDTVAGENGILSGFELQFATNIDTIEANIFFLNQHFEKENEKGYWSAVVMMWQQQRCYEDTFNAVGSMDWNRVCSLTIGFLHCTLLVSESWI